MINILFICHGNICRSPMAEFIMKDLVLKQGTADGFLIASAATSSEESGNPVYPMARQELLKHGISCEGKKARRIRRQDYEEYDYLIGMEHYNLNNMLREFKKDPENKIYRLLDFTDRPGDIDDPWYTRRFDIAYQEIELGCKALYAFLSRNFNTDSLS